MFTKQHYQLIAQLIRLYHTNDQDYRHDWAIEDFFIEAFTQDNPNFDERRFRKAIAA